MEELRDALEQGLATHVVSMTRLAGGDMAQAFAVSIDDGRMVFAKTHANPPDGFFTREAADLRWLRSAEALPVPEVLAVADGPVAFLALAWIESGSRTSSDEAEFGRRLATLHRSGAQSFGREDRRTTGSQALPNDPADTWVEFYAERRLLPLARLALDREALPERTVADLEGVAGRLAELGGPPEPPARLHGDLWAGNRMVDANGDSWLIDPAAHGGHREFDLAMMRLFGGFDEQAYIAYGEVSPLADDWQGRVPLHQLAPLVVHAIKFDGGYVAGVEGALAGLR